MPIFQKQKPGGIHSLFWNCDFYPHFRGPPQRSNELNFPKYQEGMSTTIQSNVFEIFRGGPKIRPFWAFWGSLKKTSPIIKNGKIWRFDANKPILVQICPQKWFLNFSHKNEKSLFWKFKVIFGYEFFEELFLWKKSNIFLYGKRLKTSKMVPWPPKILLKKILFKKN